MDSATRKRGAAKARDKFKSMRGQSLVEFALVAPLFFLLVFAVVDFGRLFFMQMTLQNALQEAARYAVTGQHQPDPKNPGNNLSRIASIQQVAQQAAPGMDVSNLSISSKSGGPNSGGGPKDTVTLSLTTSVPLITPVIGIFFPGGAYTFTVSVSLMNEPFPPSSTT